MPSFCHKDTLNSKVVLYQHEYCEIDTVVQETVDPSWIPEERDSQL